MSSQLASLKKLNSFQQSPLLTCKDHFEESLRRVCLAYGCPKVFMCTQCLQSDSAHVMLHEGNIIEIERFEKLVEHGACFELIENLKSQKSAVQRQLSQLDELQHANRRKIEADVQSLKEAIFRQIADEFAQIEQLLIQKSVDLNCDLSDCLERGSQTLTRCINRLSHSQAEDLAKTDQMTIRANIQQYKLASAKKISLLNQATSELNTDAEYKNFTKWHELNFEKLENSKNTDCSQYFTYYDQIVDPLFEKSLRSIYVKTANFMTSVKETLVLREWPASLEKIKNSHLVR